MKNKPTLTTSKMPKENEQQYMAWLLYCDLGSIDKLLRTWEEMALKDTDMAPELAGIMNRLGEAPSRRTLIRWSVGFQWIKRKELKLTEDLEGLREKSKKIAREKKHKILEAFGRIANKILKQLKEGTEPTIGEWKQVWEMAQVELGKPTSRGALEFRQEPPTLEEKEQAKLIDETLKPILTKQAPDSSSLDSKRKSKK